MGIARDRALPATELWPRWWRGRRHGVLVAEIDATLAQIVGSHFHGHPIPGENAYPIFLHLARRIRQRFMAVIELTLKRASGSNSRTTPSNSIRSSFANAVSLNVTGNIDDCWGK